MQDFKSILYPDLSWDDLPDEFRLQKGDPLFPRIEAYKDAEEAIQETKPKKGKKMEAAAESKDNKISIDDVFKVELKVAKILEAEKVEGADKLLKLQIDLGSEQRQIIAGIALQYQPKELVGKQIVVVANLKPATIRGVESNGMLLAASGEDGPIILTPSSEVPLGSPVK